MVWLVIGIFIVMLISLAAIIRSLRLEKNQKVILVSLSVLTFGLSLLALIGVIVPGLSDTFVKVIFFVSLGIGIITLSLSVHCLRKLHNRIFIENAKDHHENVARILAKEKEEQEK